MSAPLKPWERAGLNYQSATQFPINSMSASPNIQDRLTPAAGTVPSASVSFTTPPPVPPRPSQQSTYQSRLGPGYGFSNYGGYNSFNGFGGYSNSYGGVYSNSYSPFGYNRMGDVRSGFAQQAEESSRPAFESIESIVYAVNSVGMMLDSSFQAVYNSFRAVIGVADNFSRLKSQLLQVLSALTIIRTLRYIYRKLLEIIHLRPKGEADKLWKLASAEAASLSQMSGSGKSSWPVLLFFGIIMGGPYLIWKLISAFSSEKERVGWSRGEDDHFVGRANFSFQGQGSDELSFTAGQNIIIAPKELQPQVRGWLLGSVDGVKTGMVPANYISVLGKRQGTRHSDNLHRNSLITSNSNSTLQQQVFHEPETHLESAFFENSAKDYVDGQNKSATEILSEADN